MTMCFRWLPLLLALSASPALAIPEGPAPATPEWLQRELSNFAKVGEAPVEQASNPAFMRRFIEQGLANQQSWLERIVADSSWLGLPSGNTLVTPLCTTWAMQCAGDPFRYPGFTGPDGEAFYTTEAEVIPVLFYDRGCARISGRVWAPRNGINGLPAVVIENGSVQAPEPLYWWMAQALVRAGYVVMTFDPRGQGRSDQQTPGGEQGSNANAAVFWNGLVDAIDFFRSSSAQPYPHNTTCAGSYPTAATAFNPLIARIDATRLGIAGHSLGAIGVTVVQSYGAPGGEPWPGKIDTQNPVKVVVAWDGIPGAEGGTGGAAGTLAGLPAPIFGPLSALIGGDANRPPIVPRVPIMGQNGEYGLTPAPFLQPPDPEGQKGGFSAWKTANLPVFELTVQGSSHYEWSLLPTFPTSSWCKTVEDGRCKPGKDGGWGRPMAEHYTVAWFDRWLKNPGEAGYCDADARLLADADWTARYSFYFRSARRFSDRGGSLHNCDDIRAGMTAIPEGLDCTIVPVAPVKACTVTPPPPPPAPPVDGGGNGSSSARSDDDDSGLKGCTLGRPGQASYELPALVLLALGVLGLRRRQLRREAVGARHRPEQGVNAVLRAAVQQLARAQKPDQVRHQPHFVHRHPPHDMKGPQLRGM